MALPCVGYRLAGFVRGWKRRVRAWSWDRFIGEIRDSASPWRRRYIGHPESLAMLNVIKAAQLDFRTLRFPSHFGREEESLLRIGEVSRTAGGFPRNTRQKADRILI
jgi:hypothetical protein